MKILFLIGNFGTGGKERQLTELIKGLSKNRNHELHLLIKSKESKSKKVTKSYYFDEILNVVNSIISLEREHFGLISLWLIFKYIIKIKPDIVHSWATTTTTFAIISQWFMFKKFKLIDGSIRNTFPLKKKKILFRIEKKIHYLFSDTVIANSRAGLISYEVPRSKGLTIYNGFDFKRIEKLKSKKDIKNELNIKTPFVIGMVSNFDIRKDYDLYLETAISIIKSRKDVTFLAIGEGQKWNNYKNKYSNDRIIFTGKRDDVESIINIFSIGVLTTNPKVHNEGISNAIMEYMALGKPVIATDGEGTRELIINDKTGFLIPEENPDIFEEKIYYLLQNNKSAIEMGKKGNERIKDHFNYYNMIARFDSIYKNY